MICNEKKREYKKPVILSRNELAGLVPLVALAPAAALVGGYAVGRGVKQAMEGRIEMQERKLLCVIE